MEKWLDCTISEKEKKKTTICLLRWDKLYRQHLWHEINQKTLTKRQITKNWTLLYQNKVKAENWHRKIIINHKKKLTSG